MYVRRKAQSVRRPIELQETGKSASDIMVKKRPCAAPSLPEPKKSKGVDWSQWAEESETNDDAMDSQCLEGFEEADETAPASDAPPALAPSAADVGSRPPAEETGRRPRTPTVIIDAGKAPDGIELSGNDTHPYTPSQRRCVDIVCSSSPQLQDQFDNIKTMAERRMFVNSIVNRDAKYSTRIAPRSVAAFIQRTVTTESRKADEQVAEGKTLTQMEAEWGRDVGEEGD